jgi:D-glycero-D-manno-heptose 1,7-bisphosphate phosphatase
MGAQKEKGPRVTEPKRRAVFLDRDGTIIEDVSYLRRARDVRLLPGAAEALKLLRQAGFLLLVVSNQSAVARGWLTEPDLMDVQGEVERALEAQGAGLDGFYYCPHLPEGTVQQYARECDCRKPEPGMLLRAAGERNVDVRRSYAVGDSERDVEAGRRAGCSTILIGRGASSTADLIARDLREAADLILHRESKANAQAR